MQKLLDGISRVLAHCGFVRGGGVVLNKGAQESRDLQHLCQAESRWQLMAEGSKEFCILPSILLSSLSSDHAPDLE